MRYRLRTLLIFLATGPPMIAVVLMMATGSVVHPILLGAVVYMSLVAALIALSWTAESEATSHLAARLGAWTRAPGHCSFCARNYREAGPLAEGPHRVYICEQCIQSCSELIAAEKERIAG
jgi:hypothetical protein